MFGGWPSSKVVATANWLSQQRTTHLAREPLLGIHGQKNRHRCPRHPLVPGEPSRSRRSRLAGPSLQAAHSVPWPQGREIRTSDRVWHDVEGTTPGRMHRFSRRRWFARLPGRPAFSGTPEVWFPRRGPDRRGVHDIGCWCSAEGRRDTRSVERLGRRYLFLLSHFDSTRTLRGLSSMRSCWDRKILRPNIASA